MHAHPNEKHFQEIDAFMQALKAPPCDLIIVTNEVGMGIVPDNPMARQFRDIAGNINKKAAAGADKVILMVSGIPTIIKEEK